MKKIISLFMRNYEGDRLVRDEVVPGAEWVLSGEGVATRKFDGTCCLVRDGKLFKRYEVKAGGKSPPDFEPANDVDDQTGKQQGWVPVREGRPDDKWHLQAWNNQPTLHGLHGESTFELCGPKVQGNPEKEYVESEVGPNMHVLIPHGKFVLGDAPRTFSVIKEYLEANNFEGIVWWHPDGRMVKIKGKDFGIKRKS
jgi:hypothetical protein